MATGINDIEQAVAKLPPEDLSRFRAWFDAFIADQFDQTIEDGARAGAFDQLAQEAKAEYDRGESKPL